MLQSLGRGLHALDILRSAQEPLRLTRVAEKLGVEKSNASHILKTLVAAGYATQDESRRYSAVMLPTAHSEHSLSEVVACKENWRTVLEELVGRTGECAHLAVRVEQRVWYIDKVDSTLPLKVDHPIGSLSPLHCTALGKAFLAFGGAAIPPELTSYTEKTITDKSSLRRDIAATRTRGYAVDDAEFAQGIRCVACPIFDDSGQMIAALGVSGPTVRIDDARLDELGTLVRNAIILSRRASGAAAGLVSKAATRGRALPESSLL